MATEEITVRLRRSELALLVESLDSHEYWQLGDVLPRKDGQVFIPGDMEPDLLWEDEEPTEEQRGSDRRRGAVPGTCRSPQGVARRRPARGGLTCAAAGAFVVASTATESSPRTSDQPPRPTTTPTNPNTEEPTPTNQTENQTQPPDPNPTEPTTPTRHQLTKSAETHLQVPQSGTRGADPGVVPGVVHRVW